MVVDTVAVEIKEQVNTYPAIGFGDAETVITEEVHAPAQAEPAPQTYAAPVQTQAGSGTPTTGTAPVPTHNPPGL